MDKFTLNSTSSANYPRSVKSIVKTTNLQGVKSSMSEPKMVNTNRTSEDSKIVRKKVVQLKHDTDHLNVCKGHLLYSDRSKAFEPGHTEFGAAGPLLMPKIKLIWLLCSP